MKGLRFCAVIFVALLVSVLGFPAPASAATVSCSAHANISAGVPRPETFSSVVGPTPPEVQGLPTLSTGPSCGISAFGVTQVRLVVSGTGLLSARATISTFTGGMIITCGPSFNGCERTINIPIGSVGMFCETQGVAGAFVSVTCEATGP